MKDYVVLDLETTGLSPQQNRIIEAAAIRVRDNVVVDQFSMLINPQCTIPKFITKLTGISQDMVADAACAKDVISQLVAFVGDDVIVGHNISFDLGFLSQYHQFTQEKICTCKLARRVYHFLPSKSLGALCSHLSITNEQAHRALADILATHLLFQNMKKICDEKQIVPLALQTSSLQDCYALFKQSSY